MTKLTPDENLDDWLGTPDKSHIKHNYAATAAPGVTNDIDEGYSVGSFWFDITNDLGYFCVDITDGAAVWLEMSSATAAGVRALGFFDITNDGAGSGLDADLLDGFDSKDLLAGMSTGVIEGGVLSVGSPTSTFSISDGFGYILDYTTDADNPTFTKVTWSSQSNITVTNLATNLITYVAINSSGTVVQQTTDFTEQQHRSLIILGVAVHVDNSVVNAVDNQQRVVLNPVSQLADLIHTLGFMNVSGNVFSANGANLNLDKTAGEIFGQGINWDTDDQKPHNKTTSSGTALTFQYRLQDGTNVSTGTAVDPGNYDVSGTLTTVPNNKFTIQRIYVFVAGDVKLQPGQTVYDNLGEAKASIQTENFTTEPTILENGLLRGFLIVQQGSTDLSSPTSAVFVEANQFGSTSGASGISVSTLQSAYENSSTNPEILTEDTHGAVQLRRGTTGGDDDVVLEVQNNAGTRVFDVRGSGATDLIFTADQNDTHALEIDCDAAGFGDVKALDIVFTAGALATGSEEGVILINVDESVSTGGEIYGLEVLATDLGLAEVYGLNAGPTVNPVSQLAGVFGDMDSILVVAVDQLAALQDGGAGNITTFVADNDTITIGNATTFQDIEILLDTGASGGGIAPVFEFSTGVGTWGTFVPTDGTNGFRNTGVIAWVSADVPSWAVGAGGEYLIRITRTKNSLSTTPIIDEVQIASVTDYLWDKDGDLSINGITAANNITMTGTGAIALAPGTTAQRPGSPVNGMFRYNTDDGAFEGYASGAWGALGGAGTPEFTGEIDAPWLGNIGGTDTWIGPENYAIMEEEFIGNDASSGALFPSGLKAYQNGTGALADSRLLDSDLAHPGVLTLRTTTATSRVSVFEGANTNAARTVMGGSSSITLEILVYIDTLSDATDEFVYALGYGRLAQNDNNVPNTSFDHFALIYDRATYGTNWHIRNGDGSSTTATDTGVAVVAGAWTYLKLVYNDSTNVQAFIDNFTGTADATAVTNLPDSGDVITGGFTKVVRTAGTSVTRDIHVDWMRIAFELATDRFV